MAFYSTELFAVLASRLWMALTTPESMPAERATFTPYRSIPFFIIKNQKYSGPVHLGFRRTIFFKVPPVPLADRGSASSPRVSSQLARARNDCLSLPRYLNTTWRNRLPGELFASPPFRARENERESVLDNPRPPQSLVLGHGFPWPAESCTDRWQHRVGTRSNIISTLRPGPAGPQGCRLRPSGVLIGVSRST